MRILLLVSAFNGLSQRVRCALRDSGHEGAPRRPPLTAVPVNA